MSLVRRIIHSVAACKFDEEACSAVENLASTNVDSGLSILETLEKSELNNHAENLSSAQVAVYLAYLYRFMLVYGHEKIPYKSNIIQYLDTKDAELTSVLLTFGQAVMPKDPEMCEYIFRRHFQHRDNPLPLQIILGYADKEGKHFFTQLREYLLDKTTQFLALELLGKFVNNQGVHLHEITETPCFNTLLSIVETEESIMAVLSLALRVLVMLLPFIPASLPPILDRLFAITFNKTLLCWKSTRQPLSVHASDEMKENQQLGVCVGLFFVYLYGMFPCSLLDFLRSSDDRRWHSATKPLLASLKFNPNLAHGKSNELSVGRWKNKDPHDIVSECMNYVNSSEANANPSNDDFEELKKQIIAQQKILSSYDNSKEQSPQVLQDRFFNATQKQEKMWLQYLLHQYRKRAARLGREAMLTSAKAEEALSANERIPLLDAEVVSLHSHMQKVAKEHAAALAHAQAWTKDVMGELQKVKKDNEMLVERCSSILLDASALESSRQALVDEVKDKSDKLLYLELKLQDAHEQLAHLDDENMKMRALNDDLILWKEQQINKIGDRDVELLQEGIDQRDENISDLVEQLEAANAQIKEMRDDYQEKVMLLQQLEMEKEEWQEQMAMARNILQRQRSVDEAKLKAVEDKYASVKALYLGVEKRMLELRSENDRARQ